MAPVVIASEAKQSMPPGPGGSGLLRRFAPKKKGIDKPLILLIFNYNNV
jgi:hypothetical protein